MRQLKEAGCLKVFREKITGTTADRPQLAKLKAVVAGADMMFKGAYTQSRIRQMIFGGATRHIIMEARLPVLMAR